MKRFLYEIMYVVGISGLLYYGRYNTQKVGGSFYSSVFPLCDSKHDYTKRDIVLSIERWETWLRAKLSVGESLCW